MNRKLILYIAMSLDSYIATADDKLDFLAQVERPGEDYGHADFLQGVDTVIWGRRTFDTVLSFGQGVPYRDKAVYVISRSRTGSKEHAQYAPDVAALVRRLKQEPGKDIYCDGGGQVVLELLRHKLVDQLIVSVIPYLLGSGIRLFREGAPEQNLHFKRSITYPSGLVQLWYDVTHS